MSDAAPGKTRGDDEPQPPEVVPRTEQEPGDGPDVFEWPELDENWPSDDELGWDDNWQEEDYECSETEGPWLIGRIALKWATRSAAKNSIESDESTPGFSIDRYSKEDEVQLDH